MYTMPSLPFSVLHTADVPDRHAPFRLHPFPHTQAQCSAVSTCIAVSHHEYDDRQAIHLSK